jgi:preprotein translocase subunit SecG
MLLGILLGFLILVSVALAGVVLLQRSEGGALGMGGGPSGFMSTRGAGDLLTRTTWILGAVFFVLCLGLTILQGRLHKGSSVVDRLKIDPLAADQTVTPKTPVQPAGPAAPAPTGFEAPAPQVTTPTAPAADPFAAAATAAPAKSAPAAPAKR